MFLHDNKIMWRRMLVAMLVVLVLVACGVLWYDRPLFLVMRRFDWAPWGWLDMIFDAKVWLAVTALIILVFYIKKSLKSKPKIKNDKNRFSVVAFIVDFIEKTKSSYAFFIFCSVFMASAITMVLKVVFGRMRPLFFEALDLIGFYPFNFGWEFHSMPSGHSAATFAGLVMIGLLAPRIKWLTWTLAIIVGASRVCAGAHWPSDVLFGAFIGMVVADMVRAFITSRRVA